MNSSNSVANLTQSELDAIKNLEQQMGNKYILIAYQTQDNAQQWTEVTSNIKSSLIQKGAFFIHSLNFPLY